MQDRPPPRATQLPPVSLQRTNHRVHVEFWLSVYAAVQKPRDAAPARNSEETTTATTKQRPWRTYSVTGKTNLTKPTGWKQRDDLMEAFIEKNCSLIQYLKMLRRKTDLQLQMPLNYVAHRRKCTKKKKRKIVMDFPPDKKPPYRRDRDLGLPMI